MSRKRIARIAAGVALGAGSIFMVIAPGWASAAPVATVNCTVSAPTTGCGSQDLQYGKYALDVYQQNATYGNKIILWTRSNSDPAQDFIFRNYNGLGGSGGPDKTFEYAPNGRASGLCVSFPSTGLGTGAVLRTCNEGIWQTFRPIAAGGSYVAWQNLASGYVAEDGAYGNQGTQIDQWVHNGGDNQNWKYVS